MSGFEVLDYIRQQTGTPRTIGLPEKVLINFQDDLNLRLALGKAKEAFDTLYAEMAELLRHPEATLIEKLQSGVMNFYGLDMVTTYVPLCAQGPWVITCYGAVVYDAGGYGMLGFGHCPSVPRTLLSKEYVMANVMTANFSQYRATQKLKDHIGQNRSSGCPFSKFVFMNSGSEAISVALSISDINARLQTDPGAPHADKKIKIVTIQKAFHGRAGRPARISDSSYPAYKKHLATFREIDLLETIEANNLEQLQEVFERATQTGLYIEAVVLEPVMGEGNPGQSVTPEFYALARKLTKEHNSLLIIDSIQAGLRAQGVLSIVDYPGFENLEGPDMEAYSKALNAGQFPLSVLALTDAAANLYRQGIYGNTMTANPRALEIAVGVLDLVTPELVANIRARGDEFLKALRDLQAKFPREIGKVQGTGLLLSAELDPKIKSAGRNSVEDYLRVHGVNVIHGGINALRFTPHFAISSTEIKLVIDAVAEAVAGVSHQ